MDFVLTFLEGLASFISPCMLPMIPLYLSYFAGEDENDEEAQAIFVDKGIKTAKETAKDEETAVAEAIGREKKSYRKKYRILVRSLFFVFGFTLTYVVFGGLLGFIGGYIARYKTIVNIIAGVVVILFGLSYIGLFNLTIFKGLQKSYKISGIWSAFLFGTVFAVVVGPCTGVFLGSALALASVSGTLIKGVLLLLFYSLGMGIPFIITAVLTDKTRSLFGFIKRHFKAIRIVGGSLLVGIGILIATGIMGKISALLG